MRVVSWMVALGLVGCKDPEPTLKSTDVRISGEDGAGVADHETRMCVTVDGVVHVMWTRELDEGSQIFYARSTDVGETWEPAYALSNSPKAAKNADISCITDRVVVAWEDTRNGEIEAESIYVRSSADQGETWTEEVAIDHDEAALSRSLEPQVSIAQADAYVVWFDGVNGAFDVFVASTSTGGIPDGANSPATAWRTPIRVDGGNEGGAYSAHARIAAVPGGQAYLAWEDSRNGKSDIYFTATADGGLTFLPDVRLDKGDTAGSFNSFLPIVAAEKNLVAVVWHDERSGSGRDVLMNVSKDGGQTFKDEALRLETDTPGLADSILPDVAIRGNDVHVVWQDNRSGGYDIYYRLWSSGFASDEIRLDTNGAGFGNSTEARVTVSPDHVVAGWSDYRDDKEGLGYDDLYYSASNDGGATWFEEDKRFDNVMKATKYTESVNVAIIGDKMVASWTDARSGDEDVLFHALPIGDEAQYIQVDPEE